MLDYNRLAECMGPECPWGCQVRTVVIGVGEGDEREGRRAERAGSWSAVAGNCGGLSLSAMSAGDLSKSVGRGNGNNWGS